MMQVSPLASTVVPALVSMLMLMGSASILEAQSAVLREVTSASAAQSMTEGEGFVRSHGPIPINSLFESVRNAYRQSGIKPTSTEMHGYQIVYLIDSAGPKIGNMKIESAFDCGGDKKAPRAKTLPLGVRISTEVRQAGSNVESVTRVIAIPLASGILASDSGAEPVRCVSKGALEKKLVPETKAFTVNVVGR